jgi:hypothetical protein
MHKAERSGRITREPDGQWDITKTRARLLETADPQRSPISGSAAAEGTPFARLKVAQLALKVEAQRFALDESKGRLLDVAIANAMIDEIASTMRDALLNWPARVNMCAAVPEPRCARHHNSLSRHGRNSTASWAAAHHPNLAPGAQAARPFCAM